MNTVLSISCIIDENAHIGENIRIGNSVNGNNCTIGDNVVLNKVLENTNAAQVSLISLNVTVGLNATIPNYSRLGIFPRPKDITC
ncbi:hypothetical protein BDF21DRAFT_467756 [Thamnidium elegans]|nr:hypothetical protein BDF21DRAFT_467756 [Thamnidium elegans]